MVFSSCVFIFIFLPLIIILYYNPFFKNRIFRNIILLIFSIGFYAYGEPVYVFLMIFSIICNYLFGIFIDCHRKYGKYFLWIAVIFDLGILFAFKYINFTLENIGFLLHHNFSVGKVILPIGISFYTFQELSYVIDVYRKTTEVQKNPLNLALYVSCFPQLIAGPIVRYNTVAWEIDHRKENFEEFRKGVCKFALGLSKKVIIANNLALVAEYSFQMVHNSVLTAWLGAIAYSLQIYFDFSGYSDMAVGLGLMFGFHFMENFNYPYISKSISEFWRRWHISLTKWFTDYVYIPLGGNRVTPWRHILNLGIVWLFTGLWHGANWTFILWGILYFLIQILEKYTGFQKRLGIFGHIYTMLIVVLGWVLFNSSSVKTAIEYIGCMFGINSNGMIDSISLHYLSNYKWYFIIGILASTPIYMKVCEKCENNKNWNIVLQVCLSLLFVITISFVLSGEYDPFIYFNF